MEYIDADLQKQIDKVCVDTHYLSMRINGLNDQLYELLYPIAIKGPHACADVIQAIVGDGANPVRQRFSELWTKKIWDGTWTLTDVT